MTHDSDGPVLHDPRERLAAAGPSGRLAILLAMIEAHPEGRLELATTGGEPVLLDRIDLSPDALAETVAGRGGSPPWWDPARPGFRLRGADLRGISLRGANLRNVDLAESDLREAVLGEADLTGANLEGADLAGADLAGAIIEDAVLGGSNLQGALLEEAKMARTSMRFADLRGAALEGADLKGADLWGVKLEGAILTDADLREVRLEEADARGAELAGAMLQSARIRLTNFQKADLRGADLRGAVLGGNDFGGASLRDARLQELDLSRCEIAHVHLSGARMDETRFRCERLGGAIGEELAGEFAEAARGYLALERNFETLGDPDAASWAYRRRRRMQKLDALGRARSAWASGRRGEAVRPLAQYASDQFVEWLCDYGESIPRILASLLALYLGFTLVYGLTGSVVREVDRPGGPELVPTRRPLDLAIFSLQAMMTGPPEVFLRPRNDLALVLVGVHVFLGIALIGLLGFVMGNRIRR